MSPTGVRVQLHGMPSKIDVRDMKCICEQYGAVTNVERNFIITFASPDSAAKAIESLHGLLLNNDAPLQCELLPKDDGAAASGGGPESTADPDGDQPRFRTRRRSPANKVTEDAKAAKRVKSSTD